MTGTFRERRRRIGAAGLAIGLLAAVVPLLSASPALADTPTTHTMTASTPTQTNVAKPGPLTALVNGNTVTLTVTQASAADPITGLVQVRQCQGGLNITDSASLGPSNTGVCLSSPLQPGTDFAKTNVVKAQSTDSSITTTFKVGTGSEVVSYDDGAPHTNTITCDPTHSCSIWVEIARTGGSDFEHFDLQFAGNPDAPTVAAACTATGANVTLTAPANTGNAAIDHYTVSAASSDGGAAVGPITVTSPATTGSFAGFTQFKHYDITATATNTAGLTGAASVAAGSTLGVQTCPPGPTNVQAAVAPGQVTVSWVYGDSANATGYEVRIRDHSTADSTTTTTVAGGASTSSPAITGLTTGDDYFVSVRATYAGGNFSAFSTPEVEFAPPPNTLITQTITVRRPAGALVLTQVCGAPDTAPGASPTLTGGGADPLFPQYPYPQDPTTGDAVANYPTSCNVAMGSAKLITTGAGAGQFFQASAPLNTVTVVDTRDTDPGWTVNGRMGNFTQAIPGAIISGDELGWTPHKTSDTGSVTFSDGTTYDQTATAGPVVTPNQPNGTGLGSSSGRVLGSAIATKGLGIAVLDGVLNLWIPITARTGNYTGVLTITAV